MWNEHLRQWEPIREVVNKARVLKYRSMYRNTEVPLAWTLFNSGAFAASLLGPHVRSRAWTEGPLERTLLSEMHLLSAKHSVGLIVGFLESIPRNTASTLPALVNEWRALMRNSVVENQRPNIFDNRCSHLRGFQVVRDISSCERHFKLWETFQVVKDLPI